MGPAVNARKLSLHLPRHVISAVEPEKTLKAVRRKRDDENEMARRIQVEGKANTLVGLIDN